MSTATTTMDTAMQHPIDQRLDALDQALLGLLPRNDRLALVAQAENRIRELAAASSTAEGSLRASASLVPLPHFSVPASGGMPLSPGKRRSHLAVSSGVLGIAALVLLFGTPVIYLLVATVGEFFGEIVLYSIIGAHLLAIAIGGLTAVGLGIAALVSLRRRNGNLDGRGWAIAGLCAGPVPMLVGGLALVIGGWQLLSVQDFLGESVAAYEAPDATMPPPSDDSEPDADESNAPPSTNAPRAIGVIPVSGDRPVGEPAPRAEACPPPSESLECDLPPASFEQAGPESGAPASTPPESLRAVP